jgi:hypothetical protein
VERCLACEAVVMRRVTARRVRRPNQSFVKDHQPLWWNYTIMREPHATSCIGSPRPRKRGSAPRVSALKLGP